LGMIEIEKPVYTFRRPQNGLYWIICYGHTNISSMIVMHDLDEIALFCA
jgi:hypothetical protein